MEKLFAKEKAYSRDFDKYEVHNGTVCAGTHSKTHIFMDTAQYHMKLYRTLYHNARLDPYMPRLLTLKKAVGISDHRIHDAKQVERNMK